MDHGVVLPGKPYPRGATWDGNGLNISVFSENAERIELLLYDSAEERESSRALAIPYKTASTWHCYLPGR